MGLPNVGKSTIFSALSSAHAEAANYPFCTINPNVGVVNVPDSRLTKLTEIFNPKRTIPATVEFVDITGLVKGASKGKGLGNPGQRRERAQRSLKVQGKNEQKQAETTLTALDKISALLEQGKPARQAVLYGR